MSDTRLETFHDLANAAHLVELNLKLVDFAQNGTEACDFRVGRLDRVTGAVVLDLRRRLGLLRELAREPLAAVCDCSAQGAPGVTGKMRDCSLPAIAVGWSTSDGQSASTAPGGWRDPAGDGPARTRARLRETRSCRPGRGRSAGAGGGAGLRSG